MLILPAFFPSSTFVYPKWKEGCGVERGRDPSISQMEAIVFAIHEIFFFCKMRGLEIEEYYSPVLAGSYSVT